jgi:hypothetical protein
VWTQDGNLPRGDFTGSVFLLDEVVGAYADANNQNGGRIIHLPESLSL